MRERSRHRVTFLRIIGVQKAKRAMRSQSIGAPKYRRSLSFRFRVFRVDLEQPGFLERRQGSNLIKCQVEVGHEDFNRGGVDAADEHV